MRTLGSVMAGTVTVILVWIAVMVLFQLFTAITGYDDVNAGLLQSVGMFVAPPIAFIAGWFVFLSLERRRRGRASRR
jgi:hypothetical protein